MRDVIYKIFKSIMILQGLLWVVFVIIDVVNGTALSESWQKAVIILMLINALLFIILALLYEKAFAIKIITLCFLAVNLILTFTDQMGFFDYVVLVLNIVSIVCAVFVLRKRKTNTEAKNDG